MMTTPTTPDTNRLVRYVPKTYPTIPDSEPQYFNDELRGIRLALDSIAAALKAHEKRLADLGG